MGEYEFYVLPGSRHCREAEELLRESGIPVRTTELNNRDLLNAAPYDLGIKKAPALYANGRWYQGIEEIRKFVEEIISHENSLDKRQCFV